MTIDKKLLANQAQLLGVTLDDTALERFELFADLLVETNKKFNLTAIKEADDIVIKHFADSISLFSAIDIPEGAKILDVGTGAGFPGIPLLICRPDLKLTMLDSTGKKLAFVREALEKLGLSAEVIHSRAEEEGQGEMRESFDIVTSRAVAALNVLSEYCLPFVKVGGTFAAMKSAKAEEELGGARTAIKTLGGKFVATEQRILGDGGERNIIIINKSSQTPPKYPRVSAQISKKPL